MIYSNKEANINNFKINIRCKYSFVINNIIDNK